MKKFLSAFILFFALAILFYFYHSEKPSSHHFPNHLEYKGMTLGLFSKNADYSYEKDLKEIKKLGVDTVLLGVTWFQKNIHSSEIKAKDFDGSEYSTLPDEKLVEVIQQAHQFHLKVIVFPIIRLEERQGNDWRGLIQPDHFEEWWESYHDFILHYAKLAQKNKVELFSVGSELLSREKDAQWFELIEEVRKTFDGKLLYSANWDHFDGPLFWDKLDWIGVTAYYELTKKKNPTLQELLEAWKPFQKNLLDFKEKHPKQKLVITEVGYHSIDGTCQYSWNYYLEGKIDQQEQALCYEAFIKSWADQSALAGNFFYVWWGEGGKFDRSYMPRHKLAEDWIQAWYKD